MNSDEVRITLSEDDSRWLEDSADIQAADASEQSSQGKPSIRAEDLFAQNLLTSFQ
jgi:hypothetical protein